MDKVFLENDQSTSSRKRKRRYRMIPRIITEGDDPFCRSRLMYRDTGEPYFHL